MAVVAMMAQGQVSLQLVKPDNVIEGRKFTLTYRLRNVPDGVHLNPPQLANCKFVTGPWESTMQSISIVNGQQTQSYSIDYTFTYRADKAGRVTVPAMTVDAGGKKLTAQSATFTIYPPDRNAPATASGAPTRQQQRQVHVDDIDTQAPGPVSAKDLFIQISLNRSNVYEQEAVVCTIKVYTKFSISGFLVNTQPSFDGFVSEELPVDSRLQPDNYNGQNYYSATLKRAILYPQKSGRLTITSGKYDITVVQYERQAMGFFVTNVPVERKVSTTSNSTTLTVKPLPEPRPADFSGAVGHFTIGASLTPQLLRTNESATYALNIKGTGNIKLLKEPEVTFPPSFDTFTPTSDVNASYGNGDMTGMYKVDYTVVPQEIGDYEIQPATFTYFNPATGKYVTLHTQAFSGKVAKGSNAPVDVKQKKIEGEMNDILYIATRHNDVTSRDEARVYRTFTYWCLYALALVVFLLILYIYRRQLRLRADVQRLRQSRATRLARRRLRRADKAMKAGHSEDFYRELSAALFGYIGDKLGIQASALTRENIAGHLQEVGASEEDIQSVIDELDQCEMARFTPMGTDAIMHTLYDKALDTIRRLDAINKKSRT